MFPVLAISGAGDDASMESRLHVGAYIGWALVISLLVLAGVHPAFIEADRDRVSFKGHFLWAQPRTLEYRDILRFEYRRFGQGVRQNNDLWLVVAILRAGTPHNRVTLPYFGRKPFARLKTALTEWQIAHGCLEPTPFANFSEDVRI